MGTTKIWDIQSTFEQAIDYITNPEKTIARAAAESETPEKRAIQYAVNPDKTANRQYVTALNCNMTYAKQQFQIIKKRFGKEGGILAFHAYQSFADYDEVTPEIAHEIGVRFAEEIWGDRFQVIVATHLNTNCLHNHFVFNSVSFADGKKYHDCHSAYQHMREVSDQLCKEYGLTVIEKPQRGGEPIYMSAKSRAGMPTRYNLARAAVDEAIRQSLNLREFELHLKGLGYKVRMNSKRKYWTVTPKGWERPIRLMRLGADYTNERILQRLSEPQKGVRLAPFQKRAPVKKQYLLLTRKERIGKVGGLRGLYLKYCYLLGYLPKYTQKGNRVHESLKGDLLKCETYTKQIRLLGMYHIETKDDLNAFISKREADMEVIMEERTELRKKVRRVLPDEKIAELKIKIAVLTEEIRTVRQEIKLCQDIRICSDKIKEKLEYIEAERGTKKEKQGKNR